MRPLLVLIALGALAAAPAQGLAQRVPASLAGLPKSEVKVVTGTGTHLFKVWIAADEPSRARGLMGIKRLPEAHGMLFLFERPQLASFWMKDTWLSLDLIFIGADGVIVNIEREAPPLSLDPITSLTPVKAVLELVGGSATRIGLAPGDRIIHPAFAVQQQPKKVRPLQACAPLELRYVRLLWANNRMLRMRRFGGFLTC